MALIAAAGGGIAFGLYVELSLAGNARRDTLRVVENLVVGWAFMGAGLTAWWRRPANRLGPLMTATGFTWFFPHLGGTGVPLLFLIGLWLRHLHRVTLVHLILAFPRGRLLSRYERAVVGVGYGLVVIGGFVRVAAFDPSRLCRGPQCVLNAPLLSMDQSIFLALTRVQAGAGGALALVVLGLVIARWRRSSGPTRRALTPVWLSAGLFTVGAVAAGPTGAGALSGPALEVVHWASVIGRLAVPTAFMVGLARMRLARAAVGELVIELGRTPSSLQLQDALARTLKDPSLRLASWLPEAQCYVDLEGRGLTLPRNDPSRAVMLVEGDGHPLAAMVYDPALADERELMRAVSAAIALRLENERLHARVRGQLEEVRAARARIVEAADAARRRLERDLHDGAQQRLVSLSLRLRLTQMQLRANRDPQLQALLAQACDELQSALSDLRRLARGLHPAILAQQGLGGAIESLAEQSPFPVEVTVSSQRYPTAVETTAYFVVSEALTNTAKHAEASLAQVTIRQTPARRLLLEVKDDGIGGADPREGSGLMGLADRVAALDGQLRISSPAGQGTSIRVELPCG